MPVENQELAELFEAKYEKMKVMATHMGVPHWLVDDCIQDTYVNALRHWDKWTVKESKKGGIASRASWLFQILRNVCISNLRRESLRSVAMSSSHPRRSYSIDLPSYTKSLSYDGMQDLQAEVDLVERASALCSPKLVETMRMKVKLFTNRAAANALGIPERTVASRLKVFRDKLRVLQAHE